MGFKIQDRFASISERHLGDCDNDNYLNKKKKRDFPGGPVVKNLPANAEDTGSFLVQEDPTCLEAAKPMCHNY